MWVLAHESFHVHGIHDEPTAECWGMQAIPLVAQRLGAHPANARRMADLAWTAYRRSPSPGYDSPECRENGALDRSPGDGRWP